MAKIVLEEQPEFLVLPEESILSLKVDDLRTEERNGRNGTWTKLELTFKILGIQVIGDGSPTENYESMIGQKIWGSVPFRLTDSPENKLRLWCEAILGMELGVGFELDTDYLLSKEVRGVTSTYEKRNIDPKTGKPFRAHQIEYLLPKGAGTGVAFGQPQAAPAQDPWASAPVVAGGGAFPEEAPF
jgi:hypothetical protein